MTGLELWQYKVLQTVHDPIEKIAVQGLLGHQAVALHQIEILTKQTKGWGYRAPDRLASGADRPVVGSGETCRVNWRLSPLVTHPLQPGIRLAVEWDSLPVGRGAKRAAEVLGQDVMAALAPLAIRDGGWTAEGEVRGLLLRFWRRAPEILRGLGLQAPYLPADSRCPDHSIWDHTRVASAAAFLVELDAATRPPEREPWMLALTLGGVQRFLAEARKSRDLWTASMIYADLAWAAMRPIVEALGPDAILYPDLRGNPTADRWLLATEPEAVPESVRRTGATSHAAMLPNTFVALVPRGGGESGLPGAAELARDCVEAVRLRWQQLAGAVRAFFERRAGGGLWQAIWDRQLLARLGEPPVSWVAIPWPRRLHEIGVASPRPALPGQAQGAATPPRPAQLDSREQELAPWLEDRIWTHYELAREVFWHTDRVAETGYLTQERGFDYPLVHHQLRAALGMRKASRAPRPCLEPGEKCSLTGREEVLHNQEGGDGPPVTRRRIGARRFWACFDAEGAGGERLGSTAAIKRFLVQATEPAFTATWESPAERGLRGHAPPRVPFPSMAAIAAASFLEDLGARATEPRLARAIGGYAQAFDKCCLKATVDRRALAALARAGATPAMAELLEIEPEYLFPETLDITIRRKDGQERAGLQDFQEAGRALRRAAAIAGIRPPGKLVAVLRMDGDHMSRLILGDPSEVKTRWEDVLHPEAVTQVKKKLAGTGWTGLLGERRHAGPAFHAAISRSLADFSHKMVAWVVEREFNGRLVYAGGDDLLALLPAGEAVAAAARLEQLVSAPYVLDTDAEADPWSWRAGEAPGPAAAARLRFRVPLATEGTIRLSERRFEAHADGGGEVAGWLPEHEPVALHAMLGRGQGLSGGIAIGHFKTPLATMLSTAAEMLEREAKERLERRAVAVTLLSGGGGKAVFAGKWRLAGGSSSEAAPPDVQENLKQVVAAFGGADGKASLAGRFPYKLRESVLATGAVLVEAEDAGSWVRGLIRKEAGVSWENGEGAGWVESAARLVGAGLRLAARLRQEARRGGERPLGGDEIGQLAVGGLLLARRLALDRRADGAP